MDIKGHSNGVLGGHEEHAVGNWRKDCACYKVAKSLAHSCCSVLWQVGLVRGEIRYLAKAISKQCVERVAWFLLTAHSKMWEERTDLKMELLTGKEAEHRS